MTEFSGSSRASRAEAFLVPSNTVSSQAKFGKASGFMPIGLAMPFWPRELRAEGQRCRILWSCTVCVVGSEGVVLLVTKGAM